MKKPIRESMMTVKDAAERLSVSQETIRRWLKAGKLRGSNTPAGWRIADADVEAFLNRYKNAEPEQGLDEKEVTK